MTYKIFRPDAVNIGKMAWACDVCGAVSDIVGVSREDKKPYTKADIEEAIQLLVKQLMAENLVPLGWWNDGKCIKCPACRGATQ